MSATTTRCIDRIEHSTLPTKIGPSPIVSRTDQAIADASGGQYVDADLARHLARTAVFRLVVVEAEVVDDPQAIFREFHGVATLEEVPELSGSGTEYSVPREVPFH